MGRKRRKQQKKIAKQDEGDNKAAITPKQSDTSAGPNEVIEVSDGADDGKASNAKPSTSNTTQKGSDMNLRKAPEKTKTEKPKTVVVVNQPFQRNMCIPSTSNTTQKGSDMNLRKAPEKTKTEKTVVVVNQPFQRNMCIPSTSNTTQKGSDMNLRKAPEKTKTEKPKTVVVVNQRNMYSEIKDRRLIPRIKQYLETLSNKNFVSIPRMAEYLQKKYHEYGRKQKNVFLKYVDRAYYLINRGKTSAESDPEMSMIVSDSDGDDVEVKETLVEYKDTNSMNNMMSSIYKNSPAQGSSSGDEKNRKRKAGSQEADGNNIQNKRSKSDTEVTEKVMYASPNVLRRNIASTGLTGPRRSAADKYFIDRKGDKGDTETREVTETGETTGAVSREANIQRFLGSLPSRTSYSTYVNATNDPRQTSSSTLYKIYRDPQKPMSRQEENRSYAHGGITKSNVGVTKRAPRSPTPHPGDSNFEEQDESNSGDVSDDETERRDRGRRVKQKKSSDKSKKREKGDQVRQKKEKGPMAQTPSVTFSDIGGNESTLIEICKLLVHMRHPEVHEQLGITPPRGFLLHGPPGCGKTLLANAIAGELELPMIKVAATELVSGVSGDSEEKIRDLFDKATSCAPCVLFLDEIDSITPKRETASKDMERRIVAQLLACMDDLASKSSAHVLVIGATNRPDSIDPALRRAGRFDREICLGIPDERSRLGILRVLCKTLPLTPGFDLNNLAKATPGYVGADLIALAREAAMVAVNRVFQDLQSETKTTAAPVITAQSSSLINSPVSESSDTVTVIPLERVKITPQTYAKALSDQIKINRENFRRTIQTDVLVNTGSTNSASSGINGNTDNTTFVEISADDVNSVLQSVSCDTDMANAEVEPGAIGNVIDSATSDSVFGDALGNGMSNCVLAGDTTGNGTSDNGKQANVIVPDSEDNVIVDAGQSQNFGGNLQQQSRTQDADNAHSVPTICDNSDVNVGTVMEVDQSDSRKIQSTSGANDGNVKPTAKEELSSVLSWLKEHPPLTEDQLKNLYISIDDFKEALRYVQPSAKREGFATIPDVTWDDIGALHDIREALQLAILAPVRHAEAFQSLGLSRAQGVLLAGPPGCGKTLLAKAVANESGINFISVKGPELLNMYVGESERAVRTVFQRARNSAPCVIFFDELDALCPRRSGSSEAGSSARVVNQLLTEMDGLEERKQVFIMAATNRPDIIDPAVLRPGRLDKTLYVGLPTVSDRLDILKCITKNGTKPCLADDVDLAKIAEDQRCEGYTGADLRALLTEASLAALNEVMRQKLASNSLIRVNMGHFNTAFRKIKPSVSGKDLQKYTTMGINLTTE